VKKISYFINIALLLMLIFLLYRASERKKLLTFYTDLYEKTLIENNTLLNINTCRQAEVQLNGIVPGEEIVISDGRGHIVKTDSVFDKDKLVLYFSDGSCDMCVDDALSKLNETIRTEYAQRVVVLIGTSNKRYVSRFRANRKLNYDIYQINPENSRMVNLIMPVFFIFEHQSKRINSAFAPEKTSPADTDWYMKMVMEKYFN